MINYIAKDAAAKKESSPTRSDNSIQRIRNEPERQLGSLRDVIGNIRRDGGTPSFESIATELSVMPYSDRGSALLALQRTHGNQYVQRVVTGIQVKLKVGQPGDKYEQEADRVAEQVMRMPEPQVQRQPEEEDKKLIQTRPIVEQITPLVQRQVEEEGEEKKREEEEEIHVMTKSLSQEAPQISDDLEARLSLSRGSGNPLPKETRAFMEGRFGVDFSAVKIHKDTEAAQMARQLNAGAFTYGRDIHFGPGRYSPGTLEGEMLIAHELTHVVQQSPSIAPSRGIGNQAIQRRVRISAVTRVVDPTMNAQPRIPEFIDRLNQINPQAIRYRLDADRLAYDVIIQDHLTNFDRDMMRFIDDPTTVPLRFVNRDSSTWIDSHFRAVVDIDDLLGGSIISFQLNILHILTERFETPGYETHRQVFARPHQLAIVREMNHLRELLGDDTITYTGERERGATGYVFTFRSRRGYRIEHLFTTEQRRVRSEVFVIRGDQRMTFQQFIARQP